MKIRDIFLGKPIHWVSWAVIAGLLIWMNKVHFHILHFNFFSLALLGLAAAVMALFLVSSRPDELITRDPYPENKHVEGTGTED
jgi:hypothetical protein